MTRITSATSIAYVIADADLDAGTVEFMDLEHDIQQ
jgi:hypothetical protein